MIINVLNINDITDDGFKSMCAAADEKRRRYIDSAKIEKTKKCRIAADFLARKSVADFCGIAAEDIIFSANEYGKPYPANCNAHFSISHSGNLVICAVSDTETGVDIEEIRSVHPNASKRFATEEEQEYITADPVNFFRIWVLKEAYFKCIGTGLDSSVKSISFTVDGENVSSDKDGFDFRFISVPEGYVAAICSKKEDK